MASTSSRGYEEVIQRLIAMAKINEVSVQGNRITGRNFSFEIPKATSQRINSRSSRKR